MMRRAAERRRVNARPEEKLRNTAREGKPGVGVSWRLTCSAPMARKAGEKYDIDAAERGRRWRPIVRPACQADDMSKPADNLLKTANVIISRRAWRRSIDDVGREAVKPGNLASTLLYISAIA